MNVYPKGTEFQTTQCCHVPIRAYAEYDNSVGSMYSIRSIDYRPLSFHVTYLNLHQVRFVRTFTTGVGPPGTYPRKHAKNMYESAVEMFEREHNVNQDTLRPMVERVWCIVPFNRAKGYTKNITPCNIGGRSVQHRQALKHVEHILSRTSASTALTEGT